MASLSERRQALATALAGQGLVVPDSWGAQQPPFCIIFGDATNAQPRGGSIQWSFRVTGVQAKATDQMAQAAMDELSWKMMTAVWGLEGFRIDGLGPVAVRDLMGALHYTVDLNVTTTVDI